MRHRVPLVVTLMIALTLVLSFGLFAQVKKDAKTGQDRIEGTIQAVDAAKSSLTVVQSGATKPNWHVVYNDKTQITAHNKPAKVDSLKVGKRLIILGKFDQNVMTATRIDIRN